MSKQLLVIDTQLSAQQFKDVCPLSAGKLQGAISLSNYMAALAGGNQMASVKVKVGAVNAAAAITFSGLPTNGQQCFIGNVTVTAVSGTPGAGQFQIGGSASTTATNLAAYINANYPEVMTAVANASAGRVDITAVVPGLAGNSLGISIGTLANTTLTSSFAGGSDGTSYNLDLL